MKVAISVTRVTQHVIELTVTHVASGRSRSLELYTANLRRTDRDDPMAYLEDVIRHRLLQSRASTAAQVRAAIEGITDL